MFKIVRFPEELDSFFAPLQDRFLYGHFSYFKDLTLATAFCFERHNVSALHRCLDSERHTHRSRFNNFFNLDRWEPESLLQEKASDLLAALSPQPGETVLLVIDDSKKKKRGKLMEALGWLHDPVSASTIRGHQYVTATLSFRGYTIPFGIRLYVKDKDCPGLDVEFETTTELAASLIREFDLPDDVRVLVLFDSYYLCETVVDACEEKGFFWLSTLKSNRNLYKGGRKLKAGEYGRNLFKRQGRGRCFSPKGERGARYRYHDAGRMGLNGIGEAHVIFSRREGEKGALGIVTNDPKLSARGMIETYGERWSIEVFFKDGKQLLGLGQYQNRSYRAAVIHLHLVCFAYALLTHIAIRRRCEKGKRTNKAARLSTKALQNELRRIVWNDTARYLEKLPDGNAVVKELGRLLHAA